jgi:ArsR family transcriptional regulator
MDRDLNDVDRLCKALGDPTRLRILGLLLAGEVCVCHIHESLNIPQSKASRHLAYLRRHGLVETRKAGLWVYYRLAGPREGVSRHLLDAACACVSQLTTTARDVKRLAKLAETSPGNP